MAAGVKKLSDAVKVTLGPKGRYVALERSFGAPLVTNDGVTVAREIDLEDPVENMGAQLVREAAVKTNDVAGDGTTTATLLADVIVAEGLRNVTAGADALGIRRGIEMATEAVVDAIKASAQEVTTEDQVANVGTISAGDEVIGKKIAEAMEAVGKDGAISVEESQTFASTSISCKVCSMIAVTFHLTWQPIPSAWKQCSQIPSSCSPILRFPLSRILSRCSSRL